MYRDLPVEGPWPGQWSLGAFLIFTIELKLKKMLADRSIWVDFVG